MKCSYCHKNYKGELHYCKNCGKNLSNTIEKSDILLFFYKFNIIFGCILIVFTWFIFKFGGYSNALFGKYAYKTYILLFIDAYFIISGLILEKKFKKICKLNMKK